MFSKKMNSLKKGEGVPLLNSERAPGVQLLNSGGDGGDRGGVPGSLSHFYTMP